MSLLTIFFPLLHPSFSNQDLVLVFKTPAYKIAINMWFHSLCFISLCNSLQICNTSPSPFPPPRPSPVKSGWCLAVLPGDLLEDLSSAVHFPRLNSVFLMLFWFPSYFSKCSFIQHRHSPSSSMLVRVPWRRVSFNSSPSVCPYLP